MFEIIRTRLRQKHRTMAYPAGPPPELPPRFAGRPVVDSSRCVGDCAACQAACPTGAISTGKGPSDLQIDVGRCLFCRACQNACPYGAVRFTGDHRMAAAKREDLIVRTGSAEPAPARNELAAKLLRRSLKLRQVSAGGCNACEADCNVLSTLAWDIGRFGIQFVASPRHADGLLVTGPVTRNMREALLKTYAAVPAPKIVIAAGACAISGGPYADLSAVCNGVEGTVPVDLFIPGCPPHPLTLLDGLLAMLGILPPPRAQAGTEDRRPANPTAKRS
jgi:Ni,Fe-hydrogenase III small subunit/formate hydrogenlyase subunit 6/NADH:ubiquinone oxidoreductase subunit I